MKQSPSIGRITALALLAITGAAAGASPAQPPPQSELRPAGAVVCQRNQDVELYRRYIATEGDAITALGNCTVTLRECVVEAGGVGVKAANNAEVYIHDSEISGAVHSLWASNAAEIYFEGSTIRGRMRTTSVGEIWDQGRNTVESGDHVATPVEGGAPAESGVVRVGGIEVDATGVRIGGVGVVEIDEEGGVRVGDDAVVVDQEGVRVGGGGVLVTKEGTRVGGETVILEEGGTVAVVDGNEVVVVDADGNVRVESPDGTVVVSGDWRQGGTVYGDTDGVLIELGARTEAGGIRVELAGDILFDFDSTEIRPEAAATLSKVAHVIRRRATGRVTVTGHTDSIGAADYNQRLSEERALAVMRWLHRAEGIPLGLMAGQGLGAARPIDYNTMPDGSDNPAGRARNRRVEVLIATGS